MSLQGLELLLGLYGLSLGLGLLLFGGLYIACSFSELYSILLGLDLLPATKNVFFLGLLQGS